MKSVNQACKTQSSAPLGKREPGLSGSSAYCTLTCVTPWLLPGREEEQAGCFVLISRAHAAELRGHHTDLARLAPALRELALSLSHGPSIKEDREALA